MPSLRRPPATAALAFALAAAGGVRAQEPTPGATPVRPSVPAPPADSGRRSAGVRPPPSPVVSGRTTAATPTAAPSGRGTAPAPPLPRVSAGAVAAYARGRLLAPLAVPFRGGGPAKVLHVQVLLGAAGFSPGVLDGRWGENMRFALRAYREAAGLAEQPDDVVDAETYARLRRDANDRPPVTAYPVSAADVRGPYPAMPASIAEKASAPCLCYESLLERLGERFHVSTAVLRAMNPDVDFAALRAGDVLIVPNTWRLPPRVAVARVLVDKDEGAVRGVDSAGATVFWLPATVGSADMPSPDGALTVRSVTRNPYYRWDPAVLRDVDDRAPVRMLPPGPNSLVGLVWVALSRAHLGIHGTATPESVGYAASHGCVRLTNWDALWFAAAARRGLPVEFR